MEKPCPIRIPVRYPPSGLVTALCPFKRPCPVQRLIRCLCTARSLHSPYQWSMPGPVPGQVSLSGLKPSEMSLPGQLPGQIPVTSQMPGQIPVINQMSVPPAVTGQTQLHLPMFDIRQPRRHKPPVLPAAWYLPVTGRFS